jgi:hypothetical protein
VREHEGHRQAWLKAARAWKFIETDAAKGTTSATAEVADLVVWTGCLAYGDPNWKPGMRRASPIRSAASLAPMSADVNLVADAVRDAASTMVAIAAADYSRIRTAAQTGRLLTAVEALFVRPDGFRFTRASRYHTTNLLEAYRDAGATSVQAMDCMSQIASQVQDHNRLISERERAKSGNTDGVRIVGRRSKHKPDLLSAAGRAELNAGREMPGPVERKLLELGVTDSAFLAGVQQSTKPLFSSSAKQPREPRRCAGTLPSPDGRRSSTLKRWSVMCLPTVDASQMRHPLPVRWVVAGRDRKPRSARGKPSRNSSRLIRVASVGTDAPCAVGFPARG